MNVIRFFTILLLTIFCGCSKDNDGMLTLSPETLQLVENGLVFNSNGGSEKLKFNYTGESNIIINISYDDQQNSNWLVATTNIYEYEHSVSITCDKNNNSNIRTATIVVKAGTYSFSIRINQNAEGFVKPEITQFVFESDGGLKEINLSANGNVTAHVVYDTQKWLNIDIKGHEGVYTLSLDAEKNTGLGRIAFVKLAVDGISSATVAIRQKPGKLPSSLVISTGGAGRLYVLFGDDKSNFLNVRSLTISGNLNQLDLYVLKNFVFQGYLGMNAPLDIDMYYANLRSGYACYYPDLEIELPEYLPYVNDDVLPLGQFEFALNLRTISLPGSLRIIEDRCFWGCGNLSQIVIPDDVTVIGNNVFRLCNKLSEITISPNSILTTIGAQTFTTGCRLSSLYIPESVVNIDDIAFKSCSVDKLYVNWENPTMIDCVPRGDTLIVPKGLKSIYEETPKWNQYKHILEEESEQ